MSSAMPVSLSVAELRHGVALPDSGGATLCRMCRRRMRPDGMGPSSMRVPPKVVIEVPSCVRSGGEACAGMLVTSSGNWVLGAVGKGNHDDEES